LAEILCSVSNRRTDGMRRSGSIFFVCVCSAAKQSKHQNQKKTCKQNQEKRMNLNKNNE
jgi:hypothetical protein